MTDTALYATPPLVESADDCFFYHVMEIPDHGLVGGVWDLRGREDEYLGGVALDGQRVLEIGPASGFLTFHMESRGAEVVGVDLPDGGDWDAVPLARPDADDKDEWLAVMRQMRNGFWFAHARHASGSRVHYGDVYDLPAELGRFDVGVMGAVLLHTRDPLKVVEQCARLCDRLVITDLHVPELDGQPVQRLFPSQASTQWDTWWRFSPDLFVQYLEVLGFGTEAVTLHAQTHVSDGVEYPVPMMTIVARRGATTTAVLSSAAPGVPDAAPPAGVERRVQASYAGVPLATAAEDLLLVEEILWERAPQVVVEIGARAGGSALWLRDRLLDFQRYRVGPAPLVIAVDTDLRGVRDLLAELPAEAAARLELVEGDIRDEAVGATVTGMVPGGAEVLVIAGAAADPDTTVAALQALAPLIAPGGYVVAADGGGALEDWLGSDPLGRRFRRSSSAQPGDAAGSTGGLLQRLSDL